MTFKEKILSEAKRLGRDEVIIFKYNGMPAYSFETDLAPYGTVISISALAST